MDRDSFSTTSSDPDDYRGFVVLANELLSKCNHPTRLKEITDLTPSHFCSIYESVLGDPTPDMIRNPVSREDHTLNCQAVIDSLSMDVLHIDLSHITGESIADKDLVSICNLLEIFAGLMEYIMEHIQNNVSTDRDIDSDPDQIEQQLLSGLVQSNLKSPNIQHTEIPSRSSRSAQSPLDNTEELIRLGDPVTPTRPSPPTAGPPANPKRNSSSELTPRPQPTADPGPDGGSPIGRGPKGDSGLDTSDGVVSLEETPVNAPDPPGYIVDQEGGDFTPLRPCEATGSIQSPPSPRPSPNGPHEPSEFDLAGVRPGPGGSPDGLGSSTLVALGINVPSDKSQSIHHTHTHHHYIQPGTYDDSHVVSDGHVSLSGSRGSSPTVGTGSAYFPRATGPGLSASDGPPIVQPNPTSISEAPEIRQLPLDDGPGCGRTGVTAGNRAQPRLSGRHRKPARVILSDSEESVEVVIRPQRRRKDHRGKAPSPSKPAAPTTRGRHVYFKRDTTTASEQESRISDSQSSETELTIPDRHRDNIDRYWPYFEAADRDPVPRTQQPIAGRCRPKQTDIDDLLDRQSKGQMSDIRKQVDKESSRHSRQTENLKSSLGKTLKQMKTTEYRKIQSTQEKLKNKATDSAPWSRTEAKTHRTSSRPSTVYTSAVVISPKGSEENDGKEPSPPVSSSRIRGKTPVTLDEHEVLPFLFDEYPFLYISPETAHHMWQKQLKQMQMLTRGHNVGYGRKKSKAQLKLEDAEQRQQLLMKLMKKEMDHYNRMLDKKDKTERDHTMKCKADERKQTSARVRRYYDDFQLRQKSKMIRQRTKEELIFKKLFEDGLEIQKNRIHDLRKYAKEKREQRASKQQDEVESLENYYRDQFAMLSEAMAKERFDLQVREKAQAKAITKMKRELRNRLERDIKDLQEQLTRDDDSVYYRELEAGQLKKQLQMAMYKTEY